MHCVTLSNVPDLENQLIYLWTEVKHSKPEMVPHWHHTKPNKPKMATPSAPPIDTEPIALELFNRAAADLDTKVEIQLKKYQKFLSKK